MKNLKKLVSLILAAAIFITAFSGCGKNEPTKNEMPEFVYVPTYEKINMPEGIDWIGMVSFIQGRFYAVADAYIDKEPVVDEETGESYAESVYVQKILSFDDKGGDFKEIAVIGENNSYTQEENFYENVSRFIETPDGPAIIITRNKSVYNVPEGFDYDTGNYWDYEESTTDFIIRMLNPDGTLGEEKIFYSIENINSSESYFYPSYYTVGDNGNWYIASWDQIKVYDPDFNELYSIDISETGSYGMVKLKDGKVTAAIWSEKSIDLKVIDDSKKGFGETYSLGQNVWSLNGGNGVYDVIMATGNGTGLMGMNVGDSEPVKILDWMDSDIDSNYVYPERVFVLDEENIITIEEKWGENGTTYSVIKLKKTPSAELPEKKIITLAAVYIDYTAKEDVLEFNRTNQEYRIRVTDYSEFSTTEDPYGLTKLNTEIISGNIPDIFITGNMPMDKFAGKGVFEDLVPYIERDIGWENLVEPVFNALMNDEGKLYEIYPTFRITTYVGHKNAVGDGSSWTFNDFKEAYAKLPEGATVFADGYTKADAFYLLFENNVGNFVNWEKGECYFNTQEFIDILKFTENFPLEYDYSDYDGYYYYYDEMVKVAKGEQLLSNVNIYYLNNVRSRVLYVLGENASFVGLPTNEGTGTTFNFNSGFGYAMSATSEHKEIVWDFISEILSEEYQTENNGDRLSTNKKVFDNMMEAQMTPEFDEFYVPQDVVENNMSGESDVIVGGDVVYGETPEAEAPEKEDDGFKLVLPDFAKGQVNGQGWHELPKDYGWLENGTSYYEYPIYAMTEYEYNVIMELINSTTKISRYDESVMNIVNEEIEYFFNGERTAEQTAEYIQSRVNLYVNEQR